MTSGPVPVILDAQEREVALPVLGRTDLPGSSLAQFMESINKRLLTLPEDTIVWPGHDYGPTPSSTIGWEKRNNVNAREYGYYVAD